MNRNRLVVAHAFVAAIIVGEAALAQDRFETFAGYDRFQEVNSTLRTMVSGGRATNITWSDDGATLSYRIDGTDYAVDLATLEISEDVEEEAGAGSNRTRQGRRSPGRGRQRDREESPDGEWVAVSRDYNVILERADGSSSTPLTTDGHRKFRYGKASWVYGEELRQNSAMWWSPDSSKLAYYEFDEREVRDFYLTKGLTEWRTELDVEGYPKAGEPNPIARLWIYDLHERSYTKVDLGDDPEAYVYQVRFSPDGSLLLFNRTNRHQNVLDLVAADIDTGASRVVVTETQRTWQRNSPSIQFLADGQRFIWETEKTAFRHYELRDLDGRLINSLTHGSYPDGSVIRVDEDNAVIYYMANSDVCPLYAQLHSVGLDGSGQTRITDEPFNHQISLSPDNQWFVTTYESADAPPTVALYSMERGRVLTLGESDMTRAEEMAIEPPEMFSFKADDGVTDLYGVLYKPSNFDPNRVYPLIIDVYGGPQSQRVRSRYTAANAYCEFGFLIAVIDNRGTTGRGKAFEEAGYLRLGEIDLKDQVDGVRFLTQRPYVDGNRVGIFGHSYGGYMAALAILKHPEVFHVSVAGAPVTDWRNYDTIYTERYMRTPQENPDGYDAGSCLTFAEQLQGKLLLMHGMIDDNVHPSNAWQLVDALQRAGKSFDMYFYPNHAHGLGRSSGRIRWEFLHDHLITDSLHTAEADRTDGGGAG